MTENKFVSQIVLSILLLAAIISKRLYCDALTLKSNNANSLPFHKSYTKEVSNKAIDTKLPVVLPPSILSDYYNSIISNSAQNLRRLPVNTWPQTEYIPSSNIDEEYDNGEEYYNDDNSDKTRPLTSDIYYGNDAYQPEGWFNGPVIYDTPDSNIQNDETNDAQLNNLMMAYLLDQFDKYNKFKEMSSKRAESRVRDIITTTTLPTVTTPSNVAKVTTNAIPKKLSSKQFRLFQRGQKEFPLLRPATDNDEKTSENTIPEWPTELDEKKLSEEDSLMNLKQLGQSRTVRDVLTAQLDNLKKEGPKLH